MREPLVHFLLLGSLLFIAHSIIHRNNPAGNEIVVSAQDIDNLVVTWMNKWSRPPSEEELRTLIDDFIREEVLSREAVALGLDRGDAIVKRRLTQKMQFILDAGDTIRLPSEQELKNFFDANKDNYKSEPSYALCQITLADNSRAGMNKIHQLAELLKSKPDTAGVQHWGEITAIPFSITGTATHIDRLLGADFSRQLNDIAMNQWAGPLPTGMGSSFVYVYEKQEPADPDWMEVKSEVEKDWAEAQRQKLMQRRLNELLSKYTVRSELDEWLKTNPFSD